MDLTPPDDENFTHFGGRRGYVCVKKIMNRLHKFQLPIIMFCAITLGCQPHDSSLGTNTKTGPDSLRFVFETTHLKRYTFPTHINDLIIDRSKSQYSEVFMVIVEPGKTVIHHKHDDTEQIFYILKGTGNLLTGESKTPHGIKPGDVVRVPVGTLHSVETIGNDTIQYLCVDCFGQKPAEPTWDEHVKEVCRNNNWDFNAVTSEH